MQRNQEPASNRAVVNYKIKSQLIQKLKQRFATYGYEQVHTPTFEDYDMYASIQKTVNKDEMIKVIDRNGKVLVLRPDGTIPITRLTAMDSVINGSEQRLFYIFNVYRFQNGEGTDKENTQAGVELFGNDKPEADAEIIKLAVQTLKDIGFKNFKIEIGHAGFFKELIGKVNLSPNELQQLQDLIHSKNLVEIEPFLKKLSLPSDLHAAFQAIPLLYGAPQVVLEETKAIIQNEKMEEILNNLTDVMEVLDDYGALEYITLNLGLINNMDYYTDIIFQGFVENIGKPVLMGGRYDKLAEQFGKPMPAIGFAYELDFLLEAMKQHKLTEKTEDLSPLKLFYVPKRRRDAFSIADLLRSKGYAVITEAVDDVSGKTGILFTEEQDIFAYIDSKTFTTEEELLKLLTKKFGGE